MLTIVIVILGHIPIVASSRLLVLNYRNKEDTFREIIEVIKGEKKPYKIKSKAVIDDKVDMIIEIRCSMEDLFIERIKSVDGVNSVALVEHDGEATL